MRWIPLLYFLQIPFVVHSGESFLGCANTYAHNPHDPQAVQLDGSLTLKAETYPVNFVDPNSKFHKKLDQTWKDDEEKLLRRFNKTKRFQDHSDYAVALMHNGQPEVALQIFEELIAQHPEEYRIASNLGTAYELNGDHLQALKWIRRAVDLHPDSHQGTEWLHIRILEAKIEMETDPNWLQRNSISGVDFGSGKKPAWPSELEGDKVMQRKLLDALRYQLKERVQFVHPKDPVVAQLLFDLSNLVALQFNLFDAGQIMELALMYGNESDSATAQKRLRFYQIMTSDSIGARIQRNWLVFLIIGLFFGALSMIAIKLKIDDAREDAIREKS